MAEFYAMDCDTNKMGDICFTNKYICIIIRTLSHFFLNARWYGNIPISNPINYFEIIRYVIDYIKYSRTDLYNETVQ